MFCILKLKISKIIQYLIIYYGLTYVVCVPTDNFLLYINFYSNHSNNFIFKISEKAQDLQYSVVRIVESHNP